MLANAFTYRKELNSLLFRACFKKSEILLGRKNPAFPPHVKLWRDGAAKEGGFNTPSLTNPLPLNTWAVRNFKTFQERSKLCRLWVDYEVCWCLCLNEHKFSQISIQHPGESKFHLTCHWSWLEMIKPTPHTPQQDLGWKSWGNLRRKSTVSSTLKSENGSIVWGNNKCWV